MEDNSANEFLERKVSQPMIPFLKRSRDVDYFSEENSQSKHRYTSSRKTVTVTSTSRSANTSAHGAYNLRGGFSRGRSESPDTEQKRTRHSEHTRSRHRMVVNGATVPIEEENGARTHHRRSLSSQIVNTSDYSSDEGKGPEGLKGTAYPIYKQAGDWWDVFPKTDYTYSPISPNRKEIAPGIIPMPNMSRLSIHSDSSSEYTRRFSSSSSSNINHTRAWFGSSVSGIRALRRDRFVHSDLDIDEVDVQNYEKSPVKTSSLLQRIFTSIWSFLLYISESLSQTTRRIFSRDGSIAQRRLNFTDLASDNEDDDYVSFDRSSNKSTFILTRIVSSIFTFIKEKVHRLYFTSGSQGVSTQVDNSYHRTWLHKFYRACSWSVFKSLVLDCWISRLFSGRNSHSNAQLNNGPSRLKYLLLLFLPLLILAAWWLFSDDVTAGNSKWIIADNEFLSSKTEGLWWLLMYPFTSLWGSEKVVKLAHTSSATGQQYTVNLELLVQKIVSNEDFQNLVLSETFKRDQERRQGDQDILSSLQTQKETLEKELNQKNELLDRQHELHMELAEEVKLMKQHMLDLEFKLQTVQEFRKGPSVDSTQLWRRAVRRLEDKIKLLEVSLNSRPCCKVTPTPLPTVAIEEHVMAFLSGLFSSDGEAEKRIPGIQIWLEKLFVAKEDLESKLANITSNMNLEVGEASRRSAQAIMAMVSDQIKTEYLKQQSELNVKLSEEKRKSILPMASMNDNCTLTVSQVQDIVNNALNTYDADKTGMVDYALESSGGSIINTRCTDTYNARTATLSLLGVPLWWPSSNPRTVIQPGVSPGECWAFRGAQGYLVIRLSGRVKISAFSVEHIPLSLAPNGRIDSAPKDFSVWGLRNENDKDPELLGRYMYQDNGTSLQIFSVQRTDLPPFEIVELRIESNHGNLEYTCLYRFRVHGVLSLE